MSEKMLLLALDARDAALVRAETAERQVEELTAQLTTLQAEYDGLTEDYGRESDQHYQFMTAALETLAALNQEIDRLQVTSYNHDRRETELLEALAAWYAIRRVLTDDDAARRVANVELSVQAANVNLMLACRNALVVGMID